MEIVSEFHKNSVEIVKVSIQEFNGNPYVDARIWILNNPGEPGSEVPTKKGICIAADLLPTLIKALQSAQDKL